MDVYTLANELSEQRRAVFCCAWNYDHKEWVRFNVLLYEWVNGLSKKNLQKHTQLKLLTFIWFDYGLLSSEDVNILLTFYFIIIEDKKTSKSLKQI